MPGYTIRHLSPIGALKATYTPNTAHAPALSLRVTGDGDCRNGIISIYTRGKGIRAGDLLEIDLDDGSGTYQHYSGEVRIANSEEYSVSSEINLAGLMARLSKVEVRAARIPESGQIDPAVIARDMVEACRPQFRDAISTDLSLIPDSTGDLTALRAYFSPASVALQGLAARIPDGVFGVDGRRRVFLGVGSTTVLAINAATAGVKVTPRKVNGEGLCTAIRWQLGVGADGHPITHLSRDGTLVAEWGEHVQSVPVDDGVLYLKPIPFDDLIYAPRSATAYAYRNGSRAAENDFTPLTDKDPSTRVVLTPTFRDSPPALAVYAKSGRRIDAVRIDATSNAQRLVALNDFDPIGATETGAEGLHGMYQGWNGFGEVISGGFPYARTDGSVPDITVDFASLAPYEIDRAALDRLAEKEYRVPALAPVAIEVHGRFLAPVRAVDLTVGNTTRRQRVAELEYIVKRGWWGTVIHVEQSGEGEDGARADAIARRDALSASGVQRSLGMAAGVAKGNT